MSGSGTRTGRQKATPAAPGSTRAAPSRRSVRSGAATAPPRRARTEADSTGRPRRRRRRRVLWTVAGLITVAALAVGAAVSPILDVDEVQVSGVTPDRTAAVTRAAAVDPGDPILGVLPGRVARRVEELAWVDDARVVRDLPNTVRIEVVPRIPVGWTRAGEQILVVDADGRVIDTADAAPPGVPELVGVADVAPVGGQIRPRSLPAAAGVLGPELRQRIGSVLLDDGAVSAQLVFGPQLRFGPPDRLGLKARVAAAVLASLGPTPVAYIDVSVPTAPVSG